MLSCPLPQPTKLTHTCMRSCICSFCSSTQTGIMINTAVSSSSITPLSYKTQRLALYPHCRGLQSLCLLKELQLHLLISDKLKWCVPYPNGCHLIGPPTNISVGHGTPNTYFNGLPPCMTAMCLIPQPCPIPPHRTAAAQSPMPIGAS